MRNSFLNFFFFLLIFCTSADVYTQLKPGEFAGYSDQTAVSLKKDLIEPMADYHSYINWSKGELVAEYNIPITYNDRNIGRNNHNLTEKLKERILQFLTGAVTKIRVSSVYDLGDVFQRDQNAQIYVLSILYDRHLENAVIKNSRMQGQISVPLYGDDSITKSLYQNIRRIQSTNQINRETAGTPIYDSLLIDMVMFPNFQASLSPRITDQQGGLIHSIETVNPEILSAQSSVHYVTSITEALSHPSAGKNIAYILPDSIEMGSDIVLFNEDVDRIFGQQRTLNSIKNGNVIVIVPVKQ